MYRSRVRSGVSLVSGVASKARPKRSKSSAFDFEVPGTPITVARFRGFGERRAVTLLMCLGIFRLQGKSAFTSTGLRHVPHFFGCACWKSDSQGNPDSGDYQPSAGALLGLVCPTTLTRLQRDEPRPFFRPD